jgi:hypothetical protein
MSHTTQTPATTSPKPQRDEDNPSQLDENEDRRKDLDANGTNENHHP